MWEKIALDLCTQALSVPWCGPNVEELSFQMPNYSTKKYMPVNLPHLLPESNSSWSASELKNSISVTKIDWLE